jgi:hypothetical protein
MDEGALGKRVATRSKQNNDDDVNRRASFGTFGAKGISTLPYSFSNVRRWMLGSAYFFNGGGD